MNAREKYEKSPKKCQKCQENIPYEKRENKFCGRSCSASYNNLGVRRHKGHLGNCNYCGKKLSRGCKQYCNNQCQQDYIWEARKKEIEKTGVENSSWCAKRYLLENDRKCSICNETRWMNQPIPLILDHIDENSDNNKIENLRLVCGNCDMQLPTYKAKNTGSGRHYRRIRYKEGKSY